MSFEFNKSPQSVFRPVFAPSDERGRDRPRLPDETHLDKLEFSVRALKDLEALGITTLGQLRVSSEQFLADVVSTDSLFAT